jgi:hypothetical protein
MDYPKEKCQDIIKQTILELISDLENVFDGVQWVSVLYFAQNYFEKKSSEEVSSIVVKHVLPHKKEIVDGDDNYFLNDAVSIFSGLPTDKVKFFSEMWKNKLTEEDKITVKSYFKVLVNYSEKIKAE